MIVTAIAGDNDPQFLAVPNKSIKPALTRVRERLICEMVRGELEEAFGPGVVHNSSGQGKYFEFRPKQNERPSLRVSGFGIFARLCIALVAEEL